MIQRNKDSAPLRYLVKTLTNIWVTKMDLFIEQTSVIINLVNEEPVTGELFVSRSQLCYRKLWIFIYVPSRGTCLIVSVGSYVVLAHFQQKSVI